MHKYFILLFLIFNSSIILNTNAHQWDVDINWCHQEYNNLWWTLYIWNYHCHYSINFDNIKIDYQNYQWSESIINEFITQHTIKIEEHIKNWWFCNTLISISTVKKYKDKIIQSYNKNNFTDNFDLRKDIINGKKTEIEILYSEYINNWTIYSKLKTELKQKYPSMDTTSLQVLTYNTFYDKLLEIDTTIRDKYKDYIIDIDSYNNTLLNLNIFDEKIMQICESYEDFIIKKKNDEFNKKMQDDEEKKKIEKQNIIEKQLELKNTYKTLLKNKLWNKLNKISEKNLKKLAKQIDGLLFKKIKEDKKVQLKALKELIEEKLKQE